MKTLQPSKIERLLVFLWAILLAINVTHWLGGG